MGSGYRRSVAEPGPGGEDLVEPAGPQRLANLGYQVGFASPQHRPRPQAYSAPQAIGRPGQQRGPLGVAFGEG